MSATKKLLGASPSPSQEDIPDADWEFVEEIQQPPVNEGGGAGKKKVDAYILWKRIVGGSLAAIAVTILLNLLLWDDTTPKIVDPKGEPAVQVITIALFYWGLFWSGMICLLYYVWTGFWKNTTENKWYDKSKMTWPTKPFLIFLLVLPLIHGLLWKVWPEGWTEWYNSDMFWFVQLALAIIPLTSGKKTLWHYLAMGLILILVINEVVIVKGKDGQTRISALWQKITGKTTSPTSATASTIPARNRYFGPERDSVLAYFADIPVMADISGAESEFYHWKPSIDRSTFVFDSTDTCNGVTTNQNDNGSTDFGVMQINSVHLERARELGYDICKLEDNLAFAKVLYETEGTTPWNSSKAKWSGDSAEPTQVLTNTQTTRFAKAPADSLWGEWVDRDCDGGRFTWDPVQHGNVQIQTIDEDGPLYTNVPGSYTPVNPAGRYRWRSLTSVPTDILVKCTK